MMRHFFRLFIVWGATFGVALFVVALVLPWWFDQIEAWQGVPLPYEGALRLYILAAADLLFFGALAWLLVKGERRHWLVWCVAAASFVSLLVVFFGDTTHRLMEEFSWIRYTTSGFLFLAAVTAFFLARQYGEEGKSKRMFVVFWILIGASLLYAGLDEVLQIHEALGSFITTRAHLPSYVTDLVTMTYAVGTLVFIAFFFRKFFAEYRGRHLFFMALFVAGGIIYFVSTLFDTVDVFFLHRLRALVNVLAINERFVFGDAWYLLWALKNFFNGVEEVFEHTAATFFFTALLILFLEKRSWLLLSVSRVTRMRAIASRGVLGVVGAVVVVSLVLSLPYVFARAPLVATRGALAVSRIAGYFDGLSHADDLFYHPAWGVLVANEGKGNVYRWNNGRWGMVPDPKKVLRDTDSVTADAASIYVSDGSQGTIFRTDGKGEWEALWTKSDGLKHPEGIVVVDGVLYVIDESEKSITKLVRGEKPDVWRPSHSDWRAPEGIAYDKEREALVVTDDVSGAVFAVDFGKTVMPFARLQHPEDVGVLSDGRIVVTDNGWGAVFAIDRDGNTEKLAQFRRSYRDLQGIAVDDDGRLYVVTADGFDSVSFMPSQLFVIE